jgi:lipopolysaccharide transport system permease protein
VTQSTSRDTGATRSKTPRGPVEILDLSPGATPLPQLLRDFLRARDLIITLARRDFFSRYRRATLGVLWSIAMPLIQAGVLALVFTRVARLSLPGNAFVFVYSGMAGWAFFASAVGLAGTAVVDGSALASRIYFPRLVLPVVAVLSGSYLLMINYVIALVAVYATGGHPGIWVVLLPVSMLLAFVMSLLMSALLAAAHVYLRDLKYAIQAILLVGFYLTPVFYPLTRAPHRLRLIAEINPMTGIIELSRRATVGADPFWLRTLGISGLWLVALVIATGWLFSRYDRLFSDLL